METSELQKILDAHVAWLSGTGGARADLRGADLREADLRRANLYGANLSGANLSGANLSGANLSVANLREASLYGANLYGANLREASLYGASLYGADLSGARLPTGYAYASVGWSAHGECGRTLLAVRKPDGAVSLSCGCFSGSTDGLRRYIRDGEERYRASRSLALDVVLMLLAECPVEV